LPEVEYCNAMQATPAATLARLSASGSPSSIRPGVDVVNRRQVIDGLIQLPLSNGNTTGGSER
jgi:hypothetical protein